MKGSIVLCVPWYKKHHTFADFEGYMPQRCAKYTPDIEAREQLTL